MERALTLIYLLGQLLEIIGAFILYKNAWPEGLLKTNQGFMGNGGAQLIPGVSKHEKKSRIGFGFVALGFLMQVPLTLYNIFKY